MKIHIIDGPPSLWATDLVRQIALRPTSRNFLCIPNFSKRVDLNRVTTHTLSTIIQDSIRDLIERIDVARESKYSILFLDWSPITYLAYAKLKWIDIGPINMEYIDLLSCLIDRHTQVSLRLPNTGFPFPKSMKTMMPEEAYSFGWHLKNEYKLRFPTKIKVIWLP